ncbi:MAG TPA: right-handed parallel beta-helix repeat-containing protein, partial [Gammaproteobacteria bacterium]
MNARSTTFSAILLVCAPFAQATDWYVATGGDDDNAGTEAAPFATIQYAIDQASAGDTVIVRAGTYDQGDDPLTIWRENLTLKALAGERPLIRASVENAFAAVYFEEDNCDGSRIEGFEIEGGRNGVQVGSSWNHNVSSSPEDQYTCDDIVIHGNAIHGAAREGIKLPAGVRNIVITNNEIFDTGVAGATNAECIDAVGVIGLHVAGNYLHHCASNGVYAKGGSVDAVIENNLIMNVSQNTTHGAGIYLGFTTTDYQAFDLVNNPDTFENIDGIARNNIVINALGAGISVQSTQNARVYNNTLINVAQDAQAGIRLAAGQLCSSEPLSDDCAEEDFDITQTNVSPAIFNNIVISGGGSVVSVDDEG